MTLNLLAALLLIHMVVTWVGVGLVLRGLLAIGEALETLNPKARLKRARAAWRALPSSGMLRPGAAVRAATELDRTGMERDASSSGAPAVSEPPSSVKEGES